MARNDASADYPQLTLEGLDVRQGWIKCRVKIRSLQVVNEEFEQGNFVQDCPQLTLEDLEGLDVR